jgi:cyclophilin family peptidyl-prolyl cis-trans isomerase
MLPSPPTATKDNLANPRLRRRDLFRHASAAAVLLPTFSIPAASAIDVSAIPQQSTISSSTTYISPDDARITDKVYFDVRISRQDGSFYVRDDLPDIPENRVFQGRLTIGLFGDVVPQHVQRFKSYVAANDPLDDNPLPNYSRSIFSSLDQATGVLAGGRIAALEATTVNGGSALRYGGRLLPASLWVDAPPRVAHSSKGLLTHRQLEVLPAFGLTTRADSRAALDASHVVFGKLILDESATEFLRIVRDLPTYGMERPVDNVDSMAEETAAAVFSAQRTFFRQTAKALGDSRLEKVYEGKLLRRVEVTRVGFL